MYPQRFTKASLEISRPSYKKIAEALTLFEKLTVRTFLFGEHGLRGESMALFTSILSKFGRIQYDHLQKVVDEIIELTSLRK